MTILSSGYNLYLRQGDTGNLIVTGIPTDKNYTVYLGLYNPDNNQIITEVSHSSYTQSAGTAVFLFDETFSNALPVGDWEYGVKICADGSEDTVLPRTYVDDSGDLIKDAPPKFTVDYKYAEGD